jgi:hypothetical protein
MRLSSKIVNNKIGFLIGLIITGINGVYLLDFLKPFLSSDSVTGYGGDGSAHFAVVQYFSDNIFPAFSGWMSGWNAGMPWPVGYTPLLSYAMSFLFRLSPLSKVLTFKLAFVLLALFLPLLIYKVSRYVGASRSGGFLGSLVSIILFVYGSDSLILNYKSLFSLGNYTYFLAIVFVIPLTYISLKRTKGITDYWLISLLVLFTLLTNLHVFVAAAILLFSVTCFDSFIVRQRYVWLRYFLAATNVLLLAAFWLYPLIQTNNYFSTMPLPPLNISAELGEWPILLLIVATFLLSLAKRTARREELILLSSLSLTTTMVFLPIATLLPFIPWQPQRIWDASIIMGLILLSLSLSRILKSTTITGVVAILFITTYLPGNVVGLVPYVNGFSIAEIELIDFLAAKHDGRSLIESSDVQASQSINLSNAAGASTQHSTLWGTFRESSINMSLIQPVIGNLSSRQNYYGVTCFLCDPWFTGADKSAVELANEFAQQSFDQHIEQAMALGVKYFVFDNAESQLRASDSNLLTKIAEFSQWQVYEFTEEFAMGYVLDSPPLVVFTKLNSKTRQINDYDWLRLNEEWLFQGNLQQPLVLAKFDLATELKRFKQVFIVDYVPIDVEVVKESFLSTEDTKLFLLATTDPKFSQIMQFAEQNSLLGNRVNVIDKTGNVRQDMRQLFELIDMQANPQMITSVGNNLNQFAIPANGQDQFVYLKHSYFPWWRDLAGGEVYQASPNFQLVWTTSDYVSLKFIQDKSVVLGLFISVVGLMINLGFLSVYLYRQDQLSLHRLASKKYAK